MKCDACPSMPFGFGEPFPSTPVAGSHKQQDTANHMAFRGQPKEWGGPSRTKAAVGACQLTSQLQVTANAAAERAKTAGEEALAKVEQVSEAVAELRRALPAHEASVEACGCRGSESAGLSANIVRSRHGWGRQQEVRPKRVSS